MLKNKELLKKGSRHLGGINIGFADGHASWMNSASFMTKWADDAKTKGGWPAALGLDAWGPYSWYDDGSGPYSQAYPDDPTLR